MGENLFANWLDGELEARDWTAAKLARQAGINKATITKIRQGERRVGMDVALAIAGAFKLPEQQVLRAAGLLGDAPDETPAVEEAEHLLREMDQDDQETAVALIRALHARRGRAPTSLC